MKTEMLFLFMCLGSIGSIYCIGKEDSNKTLIRDFTALELALSSEDGIKKLLSDYKADPVLRISTRILRFTPLMVAAKTDRIDLVKLFLDAGINPDIQDANEYTALMYVLSFPDSRNCYNMTKLLLEAGASLDLVTNDKKTAWSIADGRVNATIKTLILDESKKREKIAQEIRG